MESLETKDENDICKEIKGWVRNKSVGESILHKASRLNYVVSRKKILSIFSSNLTLSLIITRMLSHTA